MLCMHRKINNAIMHSQEYHIPEDQSVPLYVSPLFARLYLWLFVQHHNNCDYGC